MKRRRLEVVALVLLVSACTSKGGTSAPAPAKAPAEAKPAALAPAPAKPTAPAAAPASAADTAKPAPHEGSVAVVNFKATAKHPAAKAAPKTPAKVAPKTVAEAAPPKAPAEAAPKTPPTKAAAKTPPKAAAPSPALVAAGKKVWARHCHICHRDGSRTEFLHHKMPDLTSPAFQKTLTDAELEGRITHGYGKPKPDGKRPMPAFAHKLSAKDIGAVAAYVRSLRR